MAQPKLRVLLVEDSSRITELLRELVETEIGAEIVYVAVDEQGAIRAVQDYDADIMVLDLQLRQGTGFGVLRALGSRRPITIIMTSYDLPQYRAAATKLGVEYFLDKTMGLECLPGIFSKISAQRSA